MASNGAGNLAGARAALRVVLDQYDHDNRVLIDQVYGQLSPTLDDFYEERLTIAFPPGPPAPGSVDIAPTLKLVRVIPVGPVREAANLGAPFPIGEVTAIINGAATDPDAPSALGDLAARLAAGSAWLAPRQVGRTQRVVVRAMPGGDDIGHLLG